MYNVAFNLFLQPRGNLNTPSSQSPRSPSASRPFLSVTVTDPVELVNGVQAYISYRVITKVGFYFGPNLMYAL